MLFDHIQHPAPKLLSLGIPGEHGYQVCAAEAEYTCLSDEIPRHTQSGGLDELCHRGRKLRFVAVIDSRHLIGSAISQCPSDICGTCPALSILLDQAYWLVLEHKFFHLSISEKKKAAPLWNGPGLFKAHPPSRARNLPI